MVNADTVEFEKFINLLAQCSSQFHDRGCVQAILKIAMILVHSECSCLRFAGDPFGRLDGCMGHPIT